MKFTQSVNYQNIDGIGRDCSERWRCIEPYVIVDPSSLSIDIGSAEGYYSKKIAGKTKGKVISVEASDLMIQRQKNYCDGEIKNGSIILITDPIVANDLDRYAVAFYDYCLLFSVLHWVDDPELFLKKFSHQSKILFVEIPELDDKNAWNQEYLRSIASRYSSIESYLEKITNKTISQEFRVSAHSSPTRRLFVIS